MKSVLNGKKKVGKATRGRVDTADHAMLLLTLEFLKHLHGLLDTITFHSLEDDKLFE